ncbi:MAG TPA: iron ABC transporter permease, partial [Fimbriimonas sp.]|nr:iron ABC transporter permease [Fimbriimonas sp.]
KEIYRGPDNHDGLNSIVWFYRLPRAVVCLFVGALLGTVGSAFQALFRNPLADPYIVGVSSGAGIGGAIAIVAGWGEWFGNLGIAGCGFVTGVLTLSLVYQLSKRRGVVDVRTLLLAGVVVGSMLSSLLSLVLLLFGKDESQILHFILGSTTEANWQKAAVLAVAFVVGFGILAVETKRLNAFALGEDVAQRLGINVRRLTKVILVVGGGMTAAAVGTVGIIGFLGLVAPHIARRLVGVDWRWSLPGSALVGAVLLIGADLISHYFFSAITQTAGMDIPVGIVTSILGAPSLVILLRKANVRM